MKKIFQEKWWIRLLLAGVLIRILLMPFTLHVDLWGHSFTAYFLAYEGKLNPYETLAGLPPDHPIVRNFGVGDIFIYPPLTYFTLGVFRLMIKPFVDPGFLLSVMEAPSEVFERADLFWNLFLFKLPYLFIDIGIGLLLAGLFEDLKKKKLAFALWMFNPVSLYATFMIGQIDILPTFFTVFSIYLIKKNKPAASLISLGIGAGYKLWPALLIIPAALYLDKDLLKRIKLVFLGFLPLIITFLPYINSEAFRYMIFSPKSQKMLFMKWPLSGAESIYPFILFLTLIYLIIYYGVRFKNINKWFLAILLLIFSVTHYHPQWFLWLTPFLVWEMVRNNFRYWLIVSILFFSWLIITLFFEPSLSFGLFAPVWHSLSNAQGLTGLTEKYINVFEFKSMIRSVFAGASIFYVYKIIKEPGQAGIAE